MKKRSLKALALLSVYALLNSQVIASGGIGLGATRVVYPLDAKQVTLSINNSSAQQNYLINAWVDDQNEKKTQQFLITPPLFVSTANTESTLRILNIGPQLPSDRESLFYISVKAIPAVDQSKNADSNVINFAILSRIKMFVRPNNLKIDVGTATQHIVFQYSNQGLQAQNNSPYYLTLVNIKLDGEEIPSVMLAPNSKQVITTKTNVKQVEFQNIDDYGALSPTMTKKTSQG